VIGATVLTSRAGEKSVRRRSAGVPTIRSVVFRIADTVAEPFGFLEPMGGQEDGDPPIAQAVDQLPDLPRRHRVEARGRLVEEEHPRVGKEGSRQGDPLAEALGEGAGPVPEAPGHADRVERGQDPLTGIPRRDAVQTREVLEVVEDGQPEVEPRRFGHDGDLVPDLGARLFRHGDPGDLRGARCGSDEGRQHPHRCGLACAVGTEEAEHLSHRHVEGDVLDGASGAEPLGQPTSPDGRFHGERECSDGSNGGSQSA